MPRHALALLVQHCALVHARDVVRDAGAADEAACAIAALLGAAEAVGAAQEVAAQEGEDAEEEEEEEEAAEEEGEAAAGLPAAVDEQLAADVFGSLLPWLAEARVGGDKCSFLRKSV